MPLVHLKDNIFVKPQQLGKLARAWQSRHGRHDLPWQQIKDPWRIWVSEVMLQQTQVARVCEYFPVFIARFPNVQACARASEHDILSAWSGLGYYRRARNLHAAAKEVVEKFAGIVPQNPLVLETLPGIGKSTANAICASAFDVPAAVLDANVRRVLLRVLGRQSDSRLWQAAGEVLDPARARQSNQAMMDLGALVCHTRNPECKACPLRKGCQAFISGDFDTAQNRVKKVRKELAMRHFLVKAERGWLLEARPQKGNGEGIWSGLYWGLTELPEGAQIIGNLEPVIWNLTHRRLIIHTQVARLDASAAQLREDSAPYTSDNARACFASLEDAPVPSVLRKLAVSAQLLLDQ